MPGGGDMRLWVDASVREDVDELIARLRGRRPFAALGSSSLRLASVADVDGELEAWRARVGEAARTVAADAAVPRLLQLVGEAYYGAHTAQLVHLGPAAKLATAAVWPRLRDAAAPGAPVDALLALVETAFVVEQLLAIRSAFATAAGGEVILSAVPGAGAACGAVGELLDAFTLAYHPRGQMLRLARANALDVIARAPQILGAIKRVLGGERGEIEALAGSWLAHVSPGEPREFWERLASLLAVFLAFAPAMGGGALRAQDVFFFPELAIAIAGGDGEFGAIDAGKLFWQLDWVARQPLADHRNLVVDRPILRVSAAPAMFATSIALLADAINWFVESSVIGYPGASGVALSQGVFRATLSEPFEREVEAVMRRLGFRAATVSHKGRWLVEPGVDLAALAGTRPPGEIDVLAVHERGFVVVLECKVLAMPTSDGRLRNLMTKLGPDDAEAIRSKVTAKLAWVQTIAPRLVPHVALAAAFIVLDRPWPGTSIEHEPYVVDVEVLETALGELLAGAADE